LDSRFSISKTGRIENRESKIQNYPRVSLVEKLLRSKLVIWVFIILPGLWPVWPIFIRPDSTVLADPLKYILHHLGFVACVLLATVLAFSPLRILFPKSGLALALNKHRRLVGVSAFAYGALHFAMHLVYEGGVTDPSSLPKILSTALEKPFQLVGMITLAILFALAITSPNAVARRLGGKRWKMLHRLAYVAAGLAAYHQAAARKIFPMQVLWIFVPLILLEVARVVKQRSAKSTPRPTPVGTAT
jgi:sulfoxide reductase heme-binding subunit YedZ